MLQATGPLLYQAERLGNQGFKLPPNTNLPKGSLKLLSKGALNCFTWRFKLLNWSLTLIKCGLENFNGGFEVPKEDLRIDKISS